MTSTLLAVALWMGPPTLPDLPAERAAKARAAAEARKQEEAKTEPQPEPEPAPEPESGVAPTSPSPPASSPAPQKPKAPVTAKQLHAASPKDEGPLKSATPAEVAAWKEDDAIYGAPGQPDEALSQPDSPAPTHAPTRTATRMKGAEPLETPLRPPIPKRSAAFVFGYRIFQTSDAFARPQSWHVGSLEVTPVRRWVRFNLITEVGAEGGPAARDGDRADLFMMQKAGLGAQYPGWLTPFVEFQGGAGMARVELFDRNDLLLLWTLGVDAGAQWAVTKWMWIHAAVGWIRPTFQRPERAVYHDSFTFKLGLGF